MMTRHTVLRTAFAAGLVALAAAGCGDMRPSQKIEIYEATLSGSQEVPPAATTASGQAEVQYNQNTGKITWKVTYTGLSAAATAGHIHGPAAVGANAGVVVPFGADVTAQPIQGETVLPIAQYADLAAGLYYVNIHSSKFPGGEIRGQLKRRM
ncbi:MAG: CHRD domain-containing protein [Burkholderiales bacterium]|nr:CHRD domain-containing protein [Burkholderiales bacterium]